MGDRGREVGAEARKGWYWRNQGTAFHGRCEPRATCSRVKQGTGHKVVFSGFGNEKATRVLHQRHFERQERNRNLSTKG